MPERELKLEAAPRFHLPDLTGAVDGLAATPPAVRRLQTVYWDTPDLRLARWGCSLRHRRGEGWTVKLPPSHEGQLLVRDEFTFAGRADAPPAQALDLLRAYVRRADLGPVALLRTRRVASTITDQSGTELAEIVDDEVSVLDGQRLALRFRQLEVEARDGAETGILDGIVARLREAGAGAPDPVAKHIRALGPRALEPPEVSLGEVHAQAPAGDAVRLALALSVTRLLRHDAGVRLGRDPEDVHQARVATRRLRSDLRTFGTLLDPDWTAGLRAELKWLAGFLGAVRDLDVMLARLRGPLVGDRERLRRARPLLRRVSSQRRVARRRLLEAMRGDRYVDLLERLVSAAQTPALGPEAEPQAAEVLPPLAARAWKQLQRAVDGAGDPPRDDELHAIRIAAKRSRYAAEAVATVAGRRAGAYAAAVAELQTVLGDFHDAVVLRGWLAEAASTLPDASAFVAGELSQRQQDVAEEARRAWPQAWKKVSRKKLRTWMTAA